MCSLMKTSGCVWPFAISTAWRIFRISRQAIVLRCPGAHTPVSRVGIAGDRWNSKTDKNLRFRISLWGRAVYDRLRCLGFDIVGGHRPPLTVNGSEFNPDNFDLKFVKKGGPTGPLGWPSARVDRTGRDVYNFFYQRLRRSQARTRWVFLLFSFLARSRSSSRTSNLKPSVKLWKTHGTFTFAALIRGIDDHLIRMAYFLFTPTSICIRAPLEISKFGFREAMTVSLPKWKKRSSDMNTYCPKHSNVHYFWLPAYRSGTA